MSKEGRDNSSFSDVSEGRYTAYGGPSNPSDRFRSRWGNPSLGETIPSSQYSTQQYDPKREEAEKGNPPTQNEDGGDQEKGIMHLLSVYADKCSLNGVVFIKSSKYTVVKAIWSALLLGSLAVMVMHLYKLAATYYSYEKQSKVDLKFENLKFPAVTICNVNAMKLSKSHLASRSLQDLIAQVDPMSMYNYVDDWTPSYMEETYHFDENGELIAGPDPYSSHDYYYDGGSGTTGWGMDQSWETEDRSQDTSWWRKKRSVEEPSEWSPTNFTWMTRTNSFFDDFNFTIVDDMWTEDYDDDMFSGSWESESEVSTFEQIAGQFIALYNQENGTVRQQMGHRIQDMLIQCSFVGRKCVQSNFTMVASSTMGNCYTIQYNKFIARKSGPREGLTLMLNLENEEYVPGITNARGAKLVVHEPGTIPFPDDEGMAIGAGMETSIGLRRVSIQRLGEPHGKCTDVDFFRRKYGIKYTRQACQEICEMEEISRHCNCYNAVKPFMYTLLRKRDDVKACQGSRATILCMEGVVWKFQDDSSCHCESPCKEVSYKKTLSSKPWPSPEFAKLMAKTVCKERPDNMLCIYDTMDEHHLKEQFVKVNIYFETLNYESMSEEPNYSEFQFVSDIGGTVGLYVGISVLSAFEMVHLIIAILRYIFVRKFC